MLKFIRKYIYYFIGISLLAIAFLTYKLFAISRDDAWQFIPDNAFLVVESSALQDVFTKKKNPAAEQLADVPFFYDALEQLKNIQQSIDNQVLTDKLYDKKLITYSLHREAQRSLEYVLYIPTDSFGDAEFLKKLTNPDITKRRIYSHSFKGIKVSELYTANNQLLFNFFLYNDYLITSRSSVLLEDVISKIKSNTPALNKNPFELSRQGLAHIYFKSRSLLNVADLLPSQLSPNLFQFFSKITPSNPDVVIENKNIPNTVSAYIYSTEKSRVPFLNIFNDQISKGLQCSKLIPQNTAICYYMGFHQTDLLKKSFNEYLRINEQSIYSERDSVNRILNIKLENFYSLLKNEVVLCEIETSGGEASGKILLMKCSDAAEALNQLEDYASKTEQFVFPKPQAINYLNYYIRPLQIYQLPSLLFGSVFQGFPSCYYTFKDDYLILANDDQTMRDYLNNLQNGQTWGSSNLYLDFLKKLNPKAQTSIIINPQRVWNNIYFSLPPRWQRSIAKHERRTKDIRFLAVESIVREKLLGTKLLLEKNPAARKEILVNRFFIQDSLGLSVPLISPPIITTNPITKIDEVIIQHLDNKAIVVSNKAKKIAEFDVKGRILDFVLPTDYFQNGQLQYLSYSKDNFYVLTHDVQKGLVPFEPTVPFAGGIKSFMANEGKVFVADGNGSIYIIEKGTQKITKLRTVRPMLGVVSLQPIQIKGNNYLAVLQDDGTLSVIYENGAYLKGYPIVAVGGKPNQLIVEDNRGGANPFIFSILSQNGEMVKVDFKGIIISRTQLERDDKSTIFEVLLDQNHIGGGSQQDWLIAQRSLTKLIIQNQKGEKLFDITNANPLKTKLKYLDLGSDVKILTVYDGFTNTIFDARGNQYGDKSLPASALPAITYSETYNKLFVYNPNKTRLEVWTLKMK